MATNVSVTVETDENADELEIPAKILELYREDPEESDAQIAGDMLVMAFTERAHALAHHGDGEEIEDIEAVESEMLDAFEDRFGLTYAEATGHSH